MTSRRRSRSWSRGWNAATATRRSSASPARARRSRWRTSSRRPGRPTLVLAHNKTLAAQLCSELKEFFPENAVEYFVSYYDYYQPEAYIPRTDTYIAKDADINEEIDKLRHAATRSLFTRRDVIIVASVSCIYGLGEPDAVPGIRPQLQERPEASSAPMPSASMVAMQYERNDMNVVRGKFRLRGDSLTILPSYDELAVRIDFFGDEVERIVELDPLTGEILAERDEIDIFPAKHFVTTSDRMQQARRGDRGGARRSSSSSSASQGKILEAARLEERTHYDIESMRETGYCSGVENYSRHLQTREPGSTPWCLLDYFPDDWLLIVDESHMTLPQVQGQFFGDRRAQGHARRVRLPPAERDGQPAADVRGVRPAHQPGASSSARRPRTTKSSARRRWSSRSSGPPACSTPRSRSGPRRTRSTT